MSLYACLLDCSVCRQAVGEPGADTEDRGEYQLSLVETARHCRSPRRRQCQRRCTTDCHVC